MSLQTIFNTRREGDVITCCGRLCHTRDTATGNKRLPVVIRRFDGGRPVLMMMLCEVCIKLWNQLDDQVHRRGLKAQTRVHIWTHILRVWSQSVPLPSASEVDGGAAWCDQTSTMSKLVEQLHSSLTEDVKEDVEAYRPASRYRKPYDWGQVTSPVTEPGVWTLNGKWNETASAQWIHVDTVFDSVEDEFEDPCSINNDKAYSGNQS